MLSVSPVRAGWWDTTVGLVMCLVFHLFVTLDQTQSKSDQAFDWSEEERVELLGSGFDVV